MEIRDSIQHDTDPTTAFTMMRDVAFQRRKAELGDGTNIEASVDDVGNGGTVIHLRRAIPTDELPDFVRNLTGATITVAEKQVWGPAASDGSRDGKAHVEIDGKPMEMNATLHLRPAADGAATTIALDGELKVRIPLVGNKIEKAAAPKMIEGIHHEVAAGKEWLAKR